MNSPICTYGNPVLRQKATPVETIDESLRAIADEMLAIMHQENGVGLAAEQVGRTERLFLIDIPADSDLDEAGERENPDVAMPLVMINPEITAHSDTIQTGPEGCLSFPDIFANIDRWYEVDACYTTLDGERKQLHAKGLLARAVQHELDHLNGILLVDRMSPVKKVALSGKLKRLVKQTHQAL